MFLLLLDKILKFSLIILLACTVTTSENSTSWWRGKNEASIGTEGAGTLDAAAKENWNGIRADQETAADGRKECAKGMLDFF